MSTTLAVTPPLPPNGVKPMSALSRLAVLAAVALPLPATAAEKLQYNRDVRPILAENCFACHGPDSAARKADLRLDVRAQAVEMGVIVPGQPDKSPVVE